MAFCHSVFYRYGHDAPILYKTNIFFPLVNIIMSKINSF